MSYPDLPCITKYAKNHVSQKKGQTNKHTFHIHKIKYLTTFQCEQCDTKMQASINKSPNETCYVKQQTSQYRYNKIPRQNLYIFATHKMATTKQPVFQKTGLQGTAERLLSGLMFKKKAKEIVTLLPLMTMGQRNNLLD